MDDDALAAIVRALDPAMTVVTAAVDGERAGCLVGFHAQSSIEPGRYTVWLSKANHTFRVALRSSHLAVHFLAAEDRPLAAWFGTVSGDERDKFAGIDVSSGPGGVPLLSQCGHRMVGRRVALLDEGGDHVCVVLQPEEATAPGPFRPLRLGDVADLDAGHSTRDRQGPPTERAGGLRGPRPAVTAPGAAPP